VVNSFGTGRLAAAILIAHQGGWDEALLVIGPIAVITGLLWLAKKRIDARLVEPGADSDPGGQAGEPGTRSMDAPTPARRPTKSS
jgi:hypothetical protein